MNSLNLKEVFLNLRKEVKSDKDFYYRVASSIYHTIKKIKEGIESLEELEKYKNAVKQFCILISYIKNIETLEYAVNEKVKNDIEKIAEYYLKNNGLNEEDFSKAINVIYYIYFVKQ